MSWLHFSLLKTLWLFFTFTTQTLNDFGTLNLILTSFAFNDISWNYLDMTHANGGRDTEVPFQLGGWSQARYNYKGIDEWLTDVREQELTCKSCFTGQKKGSHNCELGVSTPTKSRGSMPASPSCQKCIELKGNSAASSQECDVVPTNTTRTAV